VAVSDVVGLVLRDVLQPAREQMTTPRSSRAGQRVGGSVVVRSLQYVVVVSGTPTLSVSSNGAVIIVHCAVNGLVSLRLAARSGGWPRRVVSGEGLSGDAFRLGFGLVKEIVAGVLLLSGLG